LLSAANSGSQSEPANGRRPGDNFIREPLRTTSETFGGLDTGVDPKDLDFTMEGNQLVISGEKKETAEKKEQSYHHRETYLWAIHPPVAAKSHLKISRDADSQTVDSPL
jgi:hypothetical protein